MSYTLHFEKLQRRIILNSSFSIIKLFPTAFSYSTEQWFGEINRRENRLRLPKKIKILS
jgi:hypothetical protein